MIARLIRWIFAEEKQPEKQAERQERGSFFSTHVEPISDPFFLDTLTQKAFPKTIASTAVVQSGQDGKLAAMDSNDIGSDLKQVFRLNQVGLPDVQAYWYGSQGFIGYQMCAIIAQNWLIKKACRIPARDAVRKGFDIKATNEDVSPEVMDAIKAGNKRYRLNRHLMEFVDMGRVFGIRVAIFKVESDDPEYYVKPFNADGIKPGSYRGFVQVDPYWCVPELTKSSAMDPSSADFYEPNYWIINGDRYHRSHLVIMRGPEVPDILKPSYLYGGLSVPQMIYERVYAAERTANEAPQLAATKRMTVFYTDVARALANQQKFDESMLTWTQYRDNYGVKIADSVDDKIDQHDTSLADLDTVIMTQYQIVAAAANIPATKLLGTTPKGFNSTGEYEEANYHEELESIQTGDLTPLIERHITCMMRSEICPRFGIQPFPFEILWEPLDSMTSREVAEVRKINAETDKIYAIDIGAVDAVDVRNKLAVDKDGGFIGIDVSEEDQEPEGV